MPRKVSQPNENQVPIFNDDLSNWEKMILRISNGEYILVVGSEIILSEKEIPGFNGNVNKFMLDETVNGLIEDEKLGINYTCNSFSQLNEDVSSLHNKVAYYIDKRIDFSPEDVSKDLKSLLKTKCFRVVLTTTFDPYIENVMREIWGNLRVMNIFDSAGKKNDFATEEQNVSEYYDTEPTLFYVFGKAGKEREYVLTDNDAIKVITRWLDPKIQDKFKKYISQKRILAVGCKLDDWLFRFFWYALQQDITNLRKGEVAISLDPKPGTSDESLQQYLNRYKVETYNDAHNFLESLNNSLSDINLRFVNINVRRHLGGIFLSYASEDLSLVTQIFERLVKEGFDVWLDHEKLGKGNKDDYNQRIEHAINECKVFIPVFSAQTLKDYKNGKIDERYYKETEWKLAIFGPNKHHIRPIQLNGYNYREIYHKDICKGFEGIMNSTIFDIYSNPFEDFVNKIASLMK